MLALQRFQIVPWQTVMGIILFMLPVIAFAGLPHNDPENNSVEEVVAYHLLQEPFPETIDYISWTPVTLLKNGRYKVTVLFRVKNRFSRIVLKKQIVILEETGTIIKVLDLR